MLLVHLILAIITIGLTQTQLTTLNNSGIYVEVMGTLHQTTKSWNVLVHLNTSTFDEEIIMVKEETALLQKLNHNINTELLQHFNTSMMSLVSDIKNIDTLKNLLNEFLPSIRIRTKRALIGAIGKIQKYLFGTMNEDDEQNIRNAFDTIQNNEFNIIHVMENQISVLKHVTEHLNNTELKLNVNFQLIRKELTQITDKIYNLTEVTMIVHVFNEVLNTVNARIAHIKSKLNDVINSIREAKQGRLHSSILYSITFYNFIKEIRSKLPSTFRLPFETSRLDLQSINSVIQVFPTYINKTLIISVILPLITESFELQKLTSIPQPYTDNYFYYVKLDSDYIAINDMSKTILFLSSANINACIKRDSDNYLCNQVFIHHSRNINNCIMHLIKGETSHESCDIHIFKLTHELWYHTTQSNKWLYVIPVTTHIKINCGQDTKILKISNTGLLTLNRKCKAFTNEITLYTKDDVINQTVVILEYNETIPKFTIPENTNIQRMEIQNFEDFNFDSNSQNIKALKKINTLKFDNSHLSLTLIIVLILSSIISIVLYKSFCKIKCTRTNNQSQETSNNT